MSPEQRQFIAADAKQLLENKLFRDAFDGVQQYLTDKAQSCEPDNKDRAQRIVLSMQLLQQIRREIERLVEDGDVASIEIAQLENKRGIMRFIR